MSLTVPNYHRKEWIGLSLKVIFQIVLPFTLTISVMYLLFLPMVDMFSVGLPFFADQDLIVEFRDAALNEGFAYSNIILYIIFTLGGAAIIPTIILLWIMMMMFRFGNWMGDKIVIVDPIIYWRGKLITKEKK
jgi:hypothetical protein